MFFFPVQSWLVSVHFIHSSAFPASRTEGREQSGSSQWLKMTASHLVSYPLAPNLLVSHSTCTWKKGPAEATSCHLEHSHQAGAILCVWEKQTEPERDKPFFSLQCKSCLKSLSDWTAARAVRHGTPHPGPRTPAPSIICLCYLATCSLTHTQENTAYTCKQN